MNITIQPIRLTRFRLDFQSWTWKNLDWRAALVDIKKWQILGGKRSGGEKVRREKVGREKVGREKVGAAQQLQYILL